MKAISKKTLSLVVSFALLAVLFPLQALAADEDQWIAYKADGIKIDSAVETVVDKEAEITLSSDGYLDRSKITYSDADIKDIMGGYLDSDFKTKENGALDGEITFIGISLRKLAALADVMSMSDSHDIKITQENESLKQITNDPTGKKETTFTKQQLKDMIARMDGSGGYEEYYSFILPHTTEADKITLTIETSDGSSFSEAYKIVIHNKAEFKGYYGGLEVSTKTAGNNASNNKAFTYKLELGGDPTAEYDYELSDGTKGKIKHNDTFNLKNGQTLTIPYLPDGLTYKVIPTDYSSDGYITTQKADSGTIAKKDTKKAEFTQTNDVATFTMTLPKGDGYTVTPVSGYSTTVKIGETFKFYVNAENGYNIAKVTANGNLIVPKDGVYTIENIEADQEIAVSAQQTGTGANTGDTNNIVMWIGLLLLAGLALAAPKIVHKKSHNK